MNTAFILRWRHSLAYMLTVMLILTSCGSSRTASETGESPISDRPARKSSSRTAVVVEDENKDATAKPAKPAPAQTAVNTKADNSPSATNYYGSSWDNDHIQTRSSTGPITAVTLHLDAGRSSIPTCGPITSEFGPRNGKMHTGIDIKAVINSPIYCAFDGKVRMAKVYGDYGNVVVVRHTNGLETVYAHLNSIVVSVNQVVKGGEVVGTAGKSGNATAVHLHFETRFKGEAFNPRMVFDFDNCNLLTTALSLDETSFRRYGADLTVGAPQPRLASDNATSSRPTQSTYTQSNYDYSQDESLQSHTVDNASRHMVVKGDTLYSLARRYGTTVENLRRLNGIGEDNKIKEGYWIRVR